MSSSVGTFLFIGNFADMDPRERSVALEEPTLLEGITVTPQAVTVTETDGGKDGIIYADRFATNDDLSYDLGDGAQSTDLDSAFTYDATLQLGDGSTVSQEVVLLQMTNGDVFMVDVGGYSLENLAIQNVTLDTFTSDGYAGYRAGTVFADTTRVVCFDASTRISTPSGPVRAGSLRVGDLVLTDRGPRTIRWIDHRRQKATNRTAPIRISPGALGPGCPTVPTKLSPQHRVMISSSLCRSAIGLNAVLVAAKALLPLEGVRQVQTGSMVTYTHFAFDEHRIVTANGMACESFWPGDEALAGLRPSALLRLCAAVPRLLACRARRDFALPVLEGPARKALIARHLTTRQPLCAKWTRASRIDVA